MTESHPDVPPEEASRPRRRRRTPGETLRLAMAAYVFVDLLIGVPLTLVPVETLRLVGVDRLTAALIGGGFRWLGAMVAAWGVAALLVLAKPTGRAYFVTAGALQMTLGAVAFLWAWWRGDRLGETWFQVVFAVLLVATSLHLWWARIRARALLRVLAGEEPQDRA